MRYLGLCAIIKDEDPFLEEWVAYHMSLGVETFYLYDNASEIPVRDSLRRFSSLATGASIMVYDAPGKMQQMPAYHHCLAKHADDCRWIAFVDSDEFITPSRADSIPAMLAEFEPYAGLALNWRTFGSNGHKLRPQGLQIENYTRALEDSHGMHSLLKSIVNPRSAKFFPNPHFCLLRNEAEHIVSEDHLPIDRAERPGATWDKGRISHYFYRSSQDFHLKTLRPRADNGEARPKGAKPPVGEVEDRTAARFADGVRAILDRLGRENAG